MNVGGISYVCEIQTKRFQRQFEVLIKCGGFPALNKTVPPYHIAGLFSSWLHFL